MRHRLTPVLVSAACATLLMLPTILVYGAGIHPLAIATESLAYRFFYSYRVAVGEAGAAFFLPQGQTIDALGFLFQVTVGRLFDLGTVNGLAGATTAFAACFFALNWFIMLAAVAMSLSVRDRLPLAGFGVAAVLTTAFYDSHSGIDFLLSPDYYAFEASLTVMALAIGWRIAGSSRRLPSPILIGVFGGILAATKISLVGAVAFPLAGAVLHSGLSSVFAPRAVLAGGAGFAGTIALVFVVAYGFDLQHQQAAFPLWLEYVLDPGTERSFWISLFAPWSPEASPGARYQYGVVVAGLALLAFVQSWRHAIAGDPDWRKRMALLLPAVAAMAHVFSLVHRPAGTTLWEASVFLVALTAWCVVAIGPPVRLRSVEAAVAAGATALLVLSAVVNLGERVSIDRLRKGSDAVWGAHRDFMAANGSGSRVAVFPDNRYTAGSVDEAILKGFSEFPTWDITSGRATLAHVMPGLEFVTAAATLDPQKSVMWIEGAGVPSLASAPALAERQRKVDCSEYRVDTWPWRQRVIVVCPAEAP